MQSVTEFYFDIPTGDIVLGVGDTALRYTITGEETYTDMLAAADARREQGPAGLPAMDYLPQGVVPLHSLVLEPGAGSLDDRQYDRLSPRYWDKSLWMTFGPWALRVLEADEKRRKDPAIKRLDIDNFNRLGLCAHYGSLRHHCGSMTEYRHELVLSSAYDEARTFSSWTMADFVSYANRLSRSLQAEQPGHSGRPSSRDYETRARSLNDRGPGIAIIKRRIGGIQALNELIDYPDIGTWDDANYVDWGTRVLEANPGKILTKTLIDILSKRDRGPSASKVAARFKISGFQSLVADHQATLEKERAKVEQQWADTYDLLVDRQLVTAGDTVLEPAAKARIAMRYEVSRRALPHADNISIDSLARSTFNLIKDINRRRARGGSYAIEAITIEMIAERLGTFDYLWPAEHDLTGLHVMNDELLVAQRLRTDNNGYSKA